MNKTELVAAMAEQAEMTKKDAEKASVHLKYLRDLQEKAEILRQASL